MSKEFDLIDLEKCFMSITNDFSLSNKFKEKALFVFKSFFDDGLFLEKRDNIVGIKKENEKFRFYITSDESLVFPIIKKRYYYIGIDNSALLEDVENTKTQISNDSSCLMLKNKEVSSVVKRNVSINKKIKKFYEKISNEIVEFVKKSNKSIVTKEDIYTGIQYKKKYLYRAMLYSDNILLFDNYLELLDNIEINSSDIAFIRSEINHLFEGKDFFEFKHLYKRVNRLGLFVINGIDNFKKAFVLLSKIFIEFYFYRNGYIVSKVILIDKEDHDKVFSIDEELKKYIDLGDIK